jgi:hypothetical protein
MAKGFESMLADKARLEHCHWPRPGQHKTPPPPCQPPAGSVERARRFPLPKGSGWDPKKREPKNNPCSYSTASGVRGLTAARCPGYYAVSVVVSLRVRSVIADSGFWSLF